MHPKHDVMGLAPQDGCPNRPQPFTNTFGVGDIESELFDSPITPKAATSPQVPVPSSPWRLWQHPAPGDVRDVRDDETTVDAIKRANLDALRDSIKQSRYRVDPQAVAGAIVGRLAETARRRNGRWRAAAPRPRRPAA